ncbi:3D domain-containing protein [Sporosarcina aquimarina]|uniref:3D domain-containing protein n=1 Tax=Sporosarcina aquimarina TaxID=114975 RepID=A0ABU4FZZ3_9BACL|nr:3D domain-containing protein [Sporosarcina aquimarina]MDW0110304.1 3D domain-containing protein [Sporosarcina aquimarina]
MKKLIFTFVLATALMISGANESSAAASTHKVKKGDTLYKISRIHNVSVNNIMKWNGMSSTVIYPNQTLKVVSTGSTTAAKKPAKAPAKKPSRSDNEIVTKEFMANASAYTASCKGCSGITKTGLNLKKNPGLKVIAVDPKVIPLGSKVYVDGYGYAVAGDIGGAIKGNRIDVFMASHSAAIKWGRKSVRVKVLN